MAKARYAMLMLVLLAGCADLPRQLREPTLPAKAAEPVLPPATETLGVNKDAVTEVTTTAHWKDNFIIQDMEPSDPLPNLHIHSLSLANATVYEAIRSVLSGTNIPFVVNPALQVSGVSASSVTPTSSTPAASPSPFTTSSPGTPQASGLAGANGTQALPAATAAPSTNVLGNSSPIPGVPGAPGAPNLGAASDGVFYPASIPGCNAWQYYNNKTRTAPYLEFQINCTGGDAITALSQAAAQIGTDASLATTARTNDTLLWQLHG